MNTPAISVIVPTYKRPDRLRSALASLEYQIMATIEVIVVDNAADASVEKVVRSVADTSPIAIRYLAERNLGLHNARHAGARAAKGEILVFTDDDATFDPHWLRAFWEAFAAHPEMAAAGGPVRPIWEVPPPPWLVDLMGPSGTFGSLSLMHRDEGFSLSSNGVFFGVNMAIRRGVLFEVGGFNPESYGDTWLGDGETGLNRKLHSRRMQVGYVPEALVHHHIPKSRMSHGYLAQRMANEGACTEYARFRGTNPTTRPLILRWCRVGLSVGRLLLVTPLRRYLRNDRSAWLKLKLGIAYNRSRLQYLRRLSQDNELRATVEKEVWLSASH
jgi:glycosyltransferase involved in cell wall biosynthesis